MFGLAIAGDYMSAASFLGICGAIAINGYDGFLYSIGFLVAWLVALLLVRSLLRATLGVSLARRSGQAVRLSLTSASAAFSSSPLRAPALASRHAGRAPPLPA